MTKAREWVADVLEDRVARIERLTGATSSDVYRAVMQHGPPVVLRLFSNREWLALEPDLAEHEAAALRAVGASPLPTPHLLAFDATGSQAGLPAVVMSELPGTVVVDPPHLDPWLDGLAGALATLHQFEVDDFRWTYRVWQDLDRLTAPEWSSEPGRWEKLIDDVKRGLPPSPVRFVHRDFHPTNVLWSQGSVTGLVDWVNACLGPTGIDVAHCRLNLAAMHGPGTADAFSDRYRARTGSVFDPRWDLVAAVEWLPDVAAYPPWQDFGLTDLDTATVRARVEAFIDEALSRL